MKINYNEKGISLIVIILVIVVVTIMGNVGIYYYVQNISSQEELPQELAVKEETANTSTEEENTSTENIEPIMGPIIKKCSDGTLYDECSANKPKYCDDGNLIDKVSLCGCPTNYEVSENRCLTKIACQNECSQSGLKRCSDNGYQTCGNYNKDNCLEWSPITNCSINTICENGSCIQQKCSDGTIYSQCSTSKPKYCDKGNLVNKCSVCGCFVDNNRCINNETCLQFSENVDCENKQYKMAFILLVNNPNDVTPDRLNKLSWIKNYFSQGFSLATKNLAFMDTSNDINVITLQTNMIDGSYLNVGEITKKFYETYNDVYDFISIYTTISVQYNSQFHAQVVQNIKGLYSLGDFRIFDNSEGWGSEGKLKGVNFMGNIDMYDMEKLAINGLLHETGHQWCCYVGDNFTRGQDGTKLEIIQQGIHFYRGLQTPDIEGCAMDADHWISNNDGTFKKFISPEQLGSKYHPFQLYFMGLLYQEEYDTKYQIYDAGILPDMNWYNAIPYKQVSIRDIIDIAGERMCVK